jgi:Domain of unknown function (DUF3786)
MTDNYSIIARNNLNRLYGNLPKDLETNLPCERDGDRFIFKAFGEKCVVEPQKITLGEEEYSSVFSILISLYALNSCSDICITSPLKSFKEFPKSMPYVGAFKTHTEQLLVPHVAKIKKAISDITNRLNGKEVPSEVKGDFSFLVYPLPKIALCYIFYEADDDFPASVTCLYSNNANQFMPIDGLADIGEYTSRTILKLIDMNFT